MKKPVLMVAPSFDEETITYVCREFSELCGRQLEFDIIRDKKLIGGFIAMIDGTVYDTSFSSRLSDAYRRMRQ